MTEERFRPAPRCPECGRYFDAPGTSVGCDLCSPSRLDPYVARALVRAAQREAEREGWTRELAGVTIRFTDWGAGLGISLVDVLPSSAWALVEDAGWPRCRALRLSRARHLFAFARRRGANVEVVDEDGSVHVAGPY